MENLSTAQNSQTLQSAAYRLPPEVRPKRYELTLRSDVLEETFSGRVEIEIEVASPTNEIVLNAVELDISDAKVRSVEGNFIPGTVELLEELERVRIALPSILDTGEYRLILEFSGKLSNKLRGFYRSKFTLDGTEHYIATTQFEATDARRAFPCFDEPDMKAVFSITLIVKDGLTVVSNTEIVSTKELPDGWKEVRFADTIPMSTYLVAFVIGPLEVSQPAYSGDIPVRIVHAPSKGEFISFALEIATFSLQFFSDYFAMGYPANKLDLIALPDFAFGAMENLGAVTFRETLLLVDPEDAARSELERVAEVASHEIAHMWFGDTVTMRWWNGIWLNEAFATFMELLCVDAFRPEWRTWERFSLSREAALQTDGLDHTRPIEFPVRSPDEAQGMFDVLTYEKGASVLRMLERYLGAEQFREGIRGYLQKHKFANTETSDLWDALEAACPDQPVRRIMDTWIFQGGYPLITVERSKADKKQILVHQSRFRYANALEGLELDEVSSEKLPKDRNEGSDSRPNKWLVPVVARIQRTTSEATETTFVLDDTGYTITVPDENSFVVGNSGGWGFYRVHYSSDLLEPLAANFQNLTTLERYSLISDAWACVLAGLSPVEDFLSLANILRSSRELNPEIWGTVFQAITLFDKVLDEKGRTELQNYLALLTTPILEAVGWDKDRNEGEEIPVLRAEMIELLGTIGANEEVIARARELYAATTIDGAGASALDPDIASAVLNVVAYNGEGTDFDSFVERFRHPRNPQEEIRYLYALGRFAEPRSRQATLKMTLEEVRTQNAPYLLQRMLGDRRNAPFTWQHIEDHWEEIIERFPDNAIPRMLEGVRSLVGDLGLSKRVQGFLLAHPLPSGKKSIEQSIERLQVNTAFMLKQGPGLSNAISRAAETV